MCLQSQPSGADTRGYRVQGQFKKTTRMKTCLLYWFLSFYSFSWLLQERANHYFCFLPCRPTFSLNPDLDRKEKKGVDWSYWHLWVIGIHCSIERILVRNARSGVLASAVWTLCVFFKGPCGSLVMLCFNIHYKVFESQRDVLFIFQQFCAHSRHSITINVHY